MKKLLFVLAALLPPDATALDIPASAQHCSVATPPEASAKGFRPPHRNPMRLFPVNPGAQYTGCQWIWVAYASPAVWDYWSVTYYEAGTPKVQRVRYPPLPVQSTSQRCVYGADEKAQKLVEGNDWQRECLSARQLRELLVVTPKENEVWDFY